MVGARLFNLSARGFFEMPFFELWFFDLWLSLKVAPASK
jgi:hypothetical protein